MYPQDDNSFLADDHFVFPEDSSDDAAQDYGATSALPEIILDNDDDDLSDIDFTF